MILSVRGATNATSDVTVLRYQIKVSVTIKRNTYIAKTPQ